MHADKIHHYLERWRELEKRQKDLDYEYSVWARDLRSEFNPGALGDSAFSNWCVHNLAIPPAKIQELLLRSSAAKIVPDAKTWKRVGGFAQVNAMAELPPETRVRVLESAKVEQRSIRKVMRSLGLCKKQERSNSRLDAIRLSEYILNPSPRTPSDIMDIIGRYVDLVARARAA